MDRIELVRDFNRYYTRRLGLLDDRYLGQDRPLGQARLLFEIGARADLRELRARLGLDAGYLSRLLGALQRQNLVRVTTDPGDRRARVAELTADGVRERDELDARSRAGVAALLDTLTPAEQERLVQAQESIHRLLRRAAITVAVEPAGAEAARRCLLEYADELARRFPEGYDPAALSEPHELGGLVLAREEGRPVGCGAWHPLAPQVAEIRHLWVRPQARGLGLGRRLLLAVEAHAAEHGATVARLGTHRSLGEAAALYRASGYAPIPRYGDSPYNQLCFEKRL